MAYTNMINVIERYISNCQVMCHVPFIKQKANETMQVKKLFSRDTCTYGVPIFNIRYRAISMICGAKFKTFCFRKEDCNGAVM